jgi:hypothetical protein
MLVRTLLERVAEVLVGEFETGLVFAEGALPWAGLFERFRLKSGRPGMPNGIEVAAC